MTAKGKINASNVQAGDRIIVDTKVRYVDEITGDWTEGTMPSRNKTGETVTVARVIEKKKATTRRGYVIETSAGTFYAEPIQTMWLAPEDNAGIKRAHVEALAENEIREAEQTPEVADNIERIEDGRWLTVTDVDSRYVTYTGIGYDLTAGVVIRKHFRELFRVIASERFREKTERCQNEWHTSAPVRPKMLCAHCPR